MVTAAHGPCGHHTVPGTGQDPQRPLPTMPLTAIALLLLGAPLGKGRGARSGVPEPLGVLAGSRGERMESRPWEPTPEPPGLPAPVSWGPHRCGWATRGAGALGEGPWGAKGGGTHLVAPSTPPTALASSDCLGYLDEADSWRLGFSCEPTFCCGTCRLRYCCGDPSLRLSEFQQKRCLVFRWAPPALSLLPPPPPPRRALWREPGSADGAVTRGRAARRRGVWVGAPLRRCRCPSS